MCYCIISSLFNFVISRVSGPDTVMGLVHAPEQYQFSWKEFRSGFKVKVIGQSLQSQKETIKNLAPAWCL